MNALKHLTRDEVLAFADDLLPAQQLYEIGRHLIECEGCRRFLPSPTVEQFRSAIMTEWQPIEITADLNPTVSVSSKFSSIWKLPSVWAFGGSALVIAGIFIFLLMPGTKSSSDEIVRHLENEPKAELNFPAPLKTSGIDVPVTSADSNKTSPRVAETIGSKSGLPASKSLPKSDRNQKFERKGNETRGQISAIRGAGGNCSGDNSVALEFSSELENFVFKWKKVPKAVKYHLYISDDDEILIDEYETTQETSFVLRKPLDPAKTYKWKIIITLENGQTVVGPSSKFTLRNFQTSRLKSEKKRNAAIRCPAND